METPGDPTPCRPLVAPKSQVKHDQATGRRVRRVNSISFFRGCSELHRDAPQGKEKNSKNIRRTRRLDASPYEARVSAASSHTKGRRVGPGRGGGGDFPGPPKPESAGPASNRPRVGAGEPLPENFGGPMRG